VFDFLCVAYIFNVCHNSVNRNVVHCTDTGSLIISEENDSENAGMGFQLCLTSYLLFVYVTFNNKFKLII